MAAACSSDPLPLGETHQPNGGSAAPGATSTPAPGQSYGAPGGNQGPSATETNFFPLPCDEDADCRGGRCILPVDAGPRRAPTASGDAADARPSDAGALDGGALGAGFPLGRCMPNDAG